MLVYSAKLLFSARDDEIGKIESREELDCEICREKK